LQTWHATNVSHVTDYNPTPFRCCKPDLMPPSMEIPNLRLLHPKEKVSQKLVYMHFSKST